MKLTKEDVLYTAKLAHLNVEAEDVEALLLKLERILAYGDKLSELDTENVEPLYQISERANVLREDLTGKCLEIEDVCKNSALHDERTVIVPKMIG